METHNPHPASSATARLFLALWPDQATRERLTSEARQLHKRLGGRMTRPESVHLTLVFIGNLARDRLPELVARLGGVSAPAFDVVFDTVDCWPHNRIGFLGASAPPQALFDLVDALESCLRRLDIPFDRRPYKAHITLLRQARCKKETPVVDRGWSAAAVPDGLQPIHWPARDFVLVESCPTATGTVYEILARVPL